MMNSNDEVKNTLIVPCLKNGETLFNFIIEYSTRGDQLLRINSSEFEKPALVDSLDRNTFLEAVIDTVAFSAAQSEHAIKQWQRVANENKQLREMYQNSESNNSLYKLIK